ncbi:acyl-CoA dehydrogenase family protein [Pseudonocardia sp. CA-142604]|uniref:acyl-CoA dehydrogenase family protein n=1 Tax=Pseudonocardia sp. CA-142604 TaxID=3240024 RepID=UPI003D8F8BEC
MHAPRLAPTLNDSTDSTRAALLDAVRAIAPVLRDNADRAECESRLTAEAAEALRAAGLFRLGVPRAVGGAEADLATCIAVVSEVAVACPSSAWVVALSYGIQHIAASFGDTVRREVWGDGPDVAMCGSFTGLGLTATRTEGGQIVSGRWASSSGCYQAGWSAIGMPILDENDVPIDQALAIVPRDSLSIEDTWDMVGMRGTGSHTLVGERVFVPDHRIRRFADVADGASRAGEPLYRIPTGALSLALAAPLHGIARAVFAQTMELVDGGKPLAMSIYTRLADSPSVQATLADAMNLIDSAWLHMSRSAAFVGAAAAAGQQPDMVERTRVRMDAAYACRCLSDAVQLLLTVSGASSLSRAKVIQRYWRDLETAARHPALNGGLSREMYGRALVGSQDQVSPLV